MIAGLPGTGIGGLFYLIIALFMPVREFYFKIRNRDDAKRWQIVKKHYLLTIWIILGMLITGWLLGWLIEIIIPTNNVISGNSGYAENVIRVSTFLFTLFTLIIVYLNMHVLKFIFRRKINQNNGK